MRILIGMLLAMLMLTARAGNFPDAVFGSEVLAQRQMTNVLKDPDSAKYRSVHVYRTTVKGQQVYVFCGEVNARNSFGAYTGYVRFVATPVIAATEAEMQDMDNLWSILCAPANDLGAIAL